MASSGLGAREERRRRLITAPCANVRERDRLNVDCALERMRSGRAAIRSLRRSLGSVGLSWDAIGARLR